MANQIVGVGSLSCNDIFELAHLFEVTFRHFCTLSHSPHVFSPLEQSYSRAMSTAVGLGFTQALVEGEAVLPYFSWLNQFMIHRKFKENRKALPILSLCLAKMIWEGASLFRALDHPDLYPCFMEAVKAMLDNQLIHQLGKEEEACELLIKLFYD